MSRIGWSWIIYVLDTGVVMVTGATLILVKTDPVIILERKVAKLRKETGPLNLCSALK